MFIWDFVAGTVMDNLLDWLFGHIVGFLGNFFAVMGNMGVELFEMEESLDQKYREYLEQLQGKPAPELIELAPEITAAMQIHRDLASSCSEGDLDFLLQLDNPLELMAGHWREEMDGEHSGEMSHMVWNVRDRGLYEEEDLRPAPRMEML